MASLTRAQYKIAGLVVVLALVLLSLPSRTADALKSVVASLFLPLIGFASTTDALAANAVDRLMPKRELARQNSLLRRENQQLRALLLQAQEQARENARLRELVGWQAQSGWNLRVARVVARDPANWWRTLHIDLGSKDGLRENAPVLTPDGLVGRVGTVGIATSQVLLLGDPNCRVSAVVENAKRDVGVIGPAGALRSDVVELNYLPLSAEVKPGQLVLTSGLGGVFPKGIPIGRIIDAAPAADEMHLKARVKLSANLSGLEEVLVLMQ
ncbi:MAG: rod shape-determining protein MreC [Verrucomicrobiales bacterium]|nr:rod shape-determining protein MreC [Verrucomicrobiales bacterium]